MNINDHMKDRQVSYYKRKLEQYKSIAHGGYGVNSDGDSDLSLFKIVKTETGYKCTRRLYYTYSPSGLNSSAVIRFAYGNIQICGPSVFIGERFKGEFELSSVGTVSYTHSFDLLGQSDGYHILEIVFEIDGDWFDPNIMGIILTAGRG